MSRRSPILEKLADLYAESTAGVTGKASRAFSIRYDRLLSAAGCASGDAFQNARADLAAANGEALVIEKDRRSHDWRRIQVPIEREPALFARIGRVSPTAEREAWCALFVEAAGWSVPAKFAATWRMFCERRAGAASRGAGWQPFQRRKRKRAHTQLGILARLLAWEHPALIRTVSAQLAGNSKYLERCTAALHTLLAEASGGALKAFADLGIADNPRSVTFHGPVRVRLGGEWIDYSAHAGASSLSENDLATADAIECPAPRCVTVENATKFHELCALGCGDLFVFTSHPNDATTEFLLRLPATLERYHFGDTDPWGFFVLSVLRAKLPRCKIEPLHMHFRPKADAQFLNPRDFKKLESLLGSPLLADVRAELLRMKEAKTKGDFEQENILVNTAFPYTAIVNA